MSIDDLHRLRYSSCEERLAAIKQLCQGLEGVKVQFDPFTNMWKAEAPIEGMIYNGDTPDKAIDGLWELMIKDTITLEYPHKETRYVKWDGQRWVDVGN